MEDKVMRAYIKSFLLLLVFVCFQNVLCAVPTITADDFLDVMTDDNLEDIVALIGRQSGKTITTAITLSHFFLFKNFFCLFVFF